jgi:hypothetical protein
MDVLNYPYAGKLEGLKAGRPESWEAGRLAS